MSRVWEWITSKERTLEKYEEAKKEFRRILGKPVIMVPVELPDNLMHLRGEFCALENDKEFLKRVQRMCIRYIKKKHASKNASSEPNQKSST
ncbi:hypothetical protein CW712_03580 [Candidatus Bathyarchaeota archaeon]|nr:MAG: hypothetical protein CW712_03580 [Candidatus Bathyarchaeota archaeon]